MRSSQYTRAARPSGHQSRLIATVPAQCRSGGPSRGADAAAIASAALAVWRDIERALAPIIGQRGLTALCQHSLYVTIVEPPR